MYCYNGHIVCDMCHRDCGTTVANTYLLTFQEGKQAKKLVLIHFYPSKSPTSKKHPTSKTSLLRPGVFHSHLNTLTARESSSRSTKQSVFIQQKLLTTVSSHNLLGFINFQTVDRVIGFPL